MDIKQNKIDAKAVYNSNMWYFIGVNLLLSIIIGALSSFAVGIIFSGVFNFGYYKIMLYSVRKKDTKLEDLFSGFGAGLDRSLLAGLLVYVFTFLWSLLFIIPGIIKSYSYSMTYYILLDDKNISGTDAIKKSEEMMKGHKKELFLQDLSFIGWILLSILTFGILFIWLNPYMELSHAVFYERLKNSTQVAPASESSVDVNSLDAVVVDDFTVSDDSQNLNN